MKKEKFYCEDFNNNNKLKTLKGKDEKTIDVCCGNLSSLCEIYLDKIFLLFYEFYLCMRTLT